MSGLFSINLSYGDPIEGEIKLATYNGNVFYGYFGYGRDSGDRSHRGFDYVVNQGEKVIAVGAGKVVQVRIGPRYSSCYTKKSENEYVKDSEAFKCPQWESIKSNSFSQETCKNCPGKDKYQYDGEKYRDIHSICFGVQVWLKLDGDNRLYAFHAHLSNLSQAIITATRKYYKGDNTVKFTNTDDIPKVKRGDDIGKSGRTGNASGGSLPDHLHFECRKASGNEIPETGTQISPNNIVKTQFYVTINGEPVFDKNDDETVWSEIAKKDGTENKTLQQKWKDIFRAIKKNELAESYYDDNVPLTISQPAPVGNPFEFIPHEAITLHAIYNIEVIFPQQSDDNRPITPYQMIRIKRTMDSCHIQRKIGHYIGDDGTETCNIQTNQISWQQAINH